VQPVAVEVTTTVPAVEDQKSKKKETKRTWRSRLPWPTSRTVQPTGPINFSKKNGPNKEPSKKQKESSVEHRRQQPRPTSLRDDEVEEASVAAVVSPDRMLSVVAAIALMAFTLHVSICISGSGSSIVHLY
jgi:hypothetical protein